MMLAAGADPTNVAFRRAVAFIIDQILVSVVAFAAVALSGQSLLVDGPVVNGVQTVEISKSVLPLQWGVSFFYYALTAVFLVASKGWTPGKLFMGIRVVGWDGRPPGLAKAAGRAAMSWFLNIFGCFYWVAGYAVINIAKGHKGLNDMVAGTYVIDATYAGRLIIQVGGKVGAGPKSVDPDVMDEIHAQQEAQTGVHVPHGKAATEPFYDKARDTYVVFSQKQNGWIKLDKNTGEWGPL